MNKLFRILRALGIGISVSLVPILSAKDVVSQTTAFIFVLLSTASLAYFLELYADDLENIDKQLSKVLKKQKNKKVK